MWKFRPIRAGAVLLAGGGLVALTTSCGSPVPNRAPWGELVPEVRGVDGDGTVVALPEAHTGKPAVYLLGYGKRSQFDLDRWLLGLEQVEADVPVYQLAAHGSLGSSAESSWLDATTRKRLAQGTWGAAVKLDDASIEAFRAFTGNEGKGNARAMVVRGDGQVEWFSDNGYSAANAIAAREMISSLRDESWAWGLDVEAASMSAAENHSLVGTSFPAVEGESLERKLVELPGSLAGAPAVLLIGYLQETQVEIDRWILGLVGAQVEARILELPTIPGFFPRLASGWIDDGMRAGIPEEDWSAVVTLYGGSASPVAEMTGKENGRNARVVVLDAEGKVIWFDDGLYTAEKAAAVAHRLDALAAGK